MQWYYVVGGQRVGPVAAEQFEQLVREGKITGETLVWKQGMAEWQPFAAVSAVGTGAPTQATIPPTGNTANDETEICAFSGQRYPKSEMIQFQGKWISGEHRDAYFQRLREGVTQPGKFEYGNFGRRFVAKLLDGIILGVVGLLLNAVIAFAIYGSANYFRLDSSKVTMTTMFLFQGLSIGLGTVLRLGYNIIFIRKFDATPGKMALGLKVVRADGSSLSVGRIVGRFFAEIISGLILCIGYIMAGFDEERRALHDRICDTRVIKVR